MNNPLELFIKRLWLNIAFQYKVLRTVIDLVVFLYMIVPPLIAVIVYSAHLWSDKPSFLNNIPMPIIPIVLFIVLSFQSFRSFYEYGDQLFLIQRRAWYYKFKQYGVIYSFITHTLSQAVLFILLLPILYIGQGWSLLYITLLCLFTGATTTSYTLLKRQLSLIRKWWVRAIMQGLAFIFSLALYSAIVISQSFTLLAITLLSLFITLYWYAIKRQASYAKSFIEFSSYDIISRYRNLKWLLSHGDYKMPPNKNSKPKPWLFKRSNPFFKKRTTVNILVESGIKQFIRNSDYLQKYMYFALVSCYALFLLPTGGKIAYTLAFSFIFFFTAKQTWQQFMHDDFIKLHKWDGLVTINALQKGSLFFAIPGYTLLIIVLLATSPTLSVLLVHSAVAIAGYVIQFGLSALSIK